MKTVSLTLAEIHELAFGCLAQNGADKLNASALADTIMNAERDGSHSHGLFRLPAYVASLRSGKVNGKARPSANSVTPSVIRLHGDNGYAPMAHQAGIPELVKATKTTGIAILAITHIHHMAALWPEVEAIAEHNLVGLACTPYMPAVAPAGAIEALFGTNRLPLPGRALEIRLLSLIWPLPPWPWVRCRLPPVTVIRCRREQGLIRKDRQPPIRIKSQKVAYYCLSAVIRDQP